MLWSEQGLIAHTNPLLLFLSLLPPPPPKKPHHINSVAVLWLLLMFSSFILLMHPSLNSSPVFSISLLGVFLLITPLLSAPLLPLWPLKILLLLSLSQTSCLTSKSHTLGPGFITPNSFVVKMHVTLLHPSHSLCPPSSQLKHEGANILTCS